MKSVSGTLRSSNLLHINWVEGPPYPPAESPSPDDHASLWSEECHPTPAPPPVLLLLLLSAMPDPDPLSPDRLRL